MWGWRCGEEEEFSLKCVNGYGNGSSVLITFRVPRKRPGRKGSVLNCLQVDSASLASSHGEAAQGVVQTRLLEALEALPLQPVSAPLTRGSEQRAIHYHRR